MCGGFRRTPVCVSPGRYRASRSTGVQMSGIDKDQAPAAAPTDWTAPAAAGYDDALDPAVEIGVTDSRTTLAYLVARGSDDYIAVMDVLEGSVTAMTPVEVT